MGWQEGEKRGGSPLVFLLDNTGVLVLLRFRSWEVSPFFSTRNFFRVMPVLNKSAGACSTRESVGVSVCAWASSVSTAEGVGHGFGLWKS
jgi:hypothetical protein